LWSCCQIPDYRDISPAQHGEIITRVFSDLARRGHVDADWIAEQIRFCDNTSGDIDTLSQPDASDPNLDVCRKPKKLA
jgi:ATP-dependent RNA helicase SUPV3L1/SUV3